jgi:adenylate cyclase
MPMRVLLVQSDVRTAQPLIRFFKHRGDEVWQAWELGQGLTLLEQVKPDLLLIDLHFPSGDWGGVIRQARLLVPKIRIIVTNKYPDLQREMSARELGVKVFLRQPFSAKWIEQALERLSEDTRPIKPKLVGVKRESVRMPVRIKITLPYLLLAMVFALASAYLISRVVLENVEDRFLNQLIEAGKQSTDWMVREEDQLLETLRLVSNTQGIADALAAGDAETLRSAVLPLAVNAGVEEITLLDLRGTSVLTLTHTAGGGPADYVSARGSEDAKNWAFVQRVLAGEQDQTGDKFAGFAPGALHETFYVSGPVFNAQGERIGVVLVGNPLDSLARQMSADTLGDISLYNLQGKPVASTLFTVADSFPITQQQVLLALKQQDQASQTRNLKVSTVDYAEILGTWEARGGSDLGVIGISLPRAFLVRTSQVTQLEIFILVAVAILLVVVVGLYLANLITRPLLRLVAASSEVAQGNLEIKVDATGDDEVAVLAQSFNYMVAGLQEGSIYRDLLGRSVSPEVREQLRQTFTSGNLKLEGQEAVATVLFTDIRGFTTLSEKVDPATVFQWLNEYFGQLVPIVSNHGGVVNKFDGDAMLAFFGTLPRLLSPKQSASTALEASVEMLDAIDRLNAQRKARGEPEMITGIGIHTGVLIAGGLGTSDRIHYTIIGDTVNTTQRIETLTREVFDDSGILVSHSTYTALGESSSDYQFEPLGFYQVKGKKEPLQVYRVVVPKPVMTWEGTL